VPALTLPWRRAAPRQSEAAAPVAQNDHLTLFAGALQSLPDAVLIVRREGTAPAKIVASNAAAREMLRIRSEGEQLVSVLRHPDVLGAVEDTLTTDRENALTYDTGGLRSQALRVWVRSLPLAHTALVVLRDENATSQMTEMARRKAFTARMFRMSTLDFQKRTEDPKYAAQRDVADILALGGGMPINIGAETIGGIASSGSSQEQDDACAKAGVAKVADLLK
jgi:uncharacterized protein GlcG (DUF336 family)